MEGTTAPIAPSCDEAADKDLGILGLHWWHLADRWLLWQVCHLQVPCKGAYEADKIRYAGLFVSSATPGGGQESTAIAAMSTLTHHGIIYVPLGYARAYPILANLTEARGGSPWGAGTFAAPDGSRQPTKLELELAETQGKVFYEHVSRVNF